MGGHVDAERDISAHCVPGVVNQICSTHSICVSRSPFRMQNTVRGAVAQPRPETIIGPGTRNTLHCQYPICQMC